MALSLTEPYPGMVITEDTVLRPGTYVFPAGQGLTIAGQGIAVDGSGVTLLGPANYLNEGNKYQGVGILCRDCRGVTITNVRAAGFAVGLLLERSSECSITDSDFSDNFHDPDFGWGDGPPQGAVRLEHSSHNRIERVLGQRVWNGLDMRFSHHNTVEHCRFSHCSNVGLRLWHAQDNRIRRSDFSWGLRISPGEVHARDSCGVLVESGSDRNWLEDCDCSHGGDGIFVRMLNGWASSGNVFIGNDCSYANNNAVECWSPGNTFIRNTASFSSYGFWLGGSDETLLKDNTVHGSGGHAPEAFGNAGIAVVNGSGRHLKLVGNVVQYTRGPGIAIRHKPDDPSYHWVVQQNVIHHSQDDERGYRGHGIYLEHAQWLHIAGNRFAGNAGDDVAFGPNVKEVSILRDLALGPPPEAHAVMEPKHVRVGEPVLFSAAQSRSRSGRPLRFRWQVNRSDAGSASRYAHQFDRPGLHTVAVLVDDGQLADLAQFTVSAVETDLEVGTNAPAVDWQLTSDDPKARLVRDERETVTGRGSLAVLAEAGTCHALTYPQAGGLGLPWADFQRLSCWIRFESEPYVDKEHLGPIFELCADSENWVRYRPTVPYILERLLAPQSPERAGWMLVDIPLWESCELWQREVMGTPQKGRLESIRIEEGPSADGVSRFWLDALQLHRG